MDTQPPASTLTDAQYRQQCDLVFQRIESTVDRWLQDDVVDIDPQRTGGLLELSFTGGGKIVVNSQPPLHELWLAARTGGRHYRFQGGRWVDTRDGSEFFEALSREASLLAGLSLTF